MPDIGYGYQQGGLRGPGEPLDHAPGARPRHQLRVQPERDRAQHRHPARARDRDAPRRAGPVRGAARRSASAWRSPSGRGCGQRSSRRASVPFVQAAPELPDVRLRLRGQLARRRRRRAARACRRRTSSSPAGSPTTMLDGSTAAPPCTCRPRATRASACAVAEAMLAGCVPVVTRRARCPRWWATPGSQVDVPADPGALRRPPGRRWHGVPAPGKRRGSAYCASSRSTHGRPRCMISSSGRSAVGSTEHERGADHEVFFSGRRLKPGSRPRRAGQPGEGEDELRRARTPSPRPQPKDPDETAVRHFDVDDPSEVRGDEQAELKRQDRWPRREQHPAGGRYEVIEEIKP